LSTHHGKTAKLQKAKAKAISMLSWQGCAQFGFKFARFSQQANTTPWLLMCD